MTTHPASFSVRDLLLALSVVGIWGTNFVVVKLGLAHLPPLLLAALRFSLALMPAVFFVPRPAVMHGALRDSEALPYRRGSIDDAPPASPPLIGLFLRTERSLGLRGDSKSQPNRRESINALRTH